MDSSSLRRLLSDIHLTDNYDESLVDAISNMEGPHELLSFAKSLKDEGNSKFKAGQVKSANELYDKAIKSLCLCMPLKGSLEQLYRDLVISLHLNLAACALKCNELERANLYCSFVLELDSENVKALFRRAVASRKLHDHGSAHRDISRAASIEPSNTDVLKELTIVEGLIKKASTGKRNLESDPSPDIIRKGKRVHSQGHVGETHSLSVASQPGNPFSFLENYSTPINIKENVEGSVLQDGGHVDADFQDVSSQCSNNNFPSIDAPPLIESKKVPFKFLNKRRASALNIHQNTYERILRGDTVSFFQSSTLTRLTIRIHKPKVDKDKETPYQEEDDEISRIESVADDFDVSSKKVKEHEEHSKSDDSSKGSRNDISPRINSRTTGCLMTTKKNFKRSRRVHPNYNRSWVHPNYNRTSIPAYCLMLRRSFMRTWATGNLNRDSNSSLSCRYSDRYKSGIAQKIRPLSFIRKKQKYFIAGSQSYNINDCRIIM